MAWPRTRPRLRTVAHPSRLGVLPLLPLWLTVLLWGAASRGEEVTLTRDQQVAILLEATRAFDRGAGIAREQPDAAAAAFTEAAQKFQLLIDSGVRNGKLYYNAANAWLRLNEVGRAILCYRRAQKLRPGDGQIEANLRYARQLRRNQIPPSGERAFIETLLSWHFSTSPRQRFGVGLAAYSAFWGLLIARAFFPRRGLVYALVPLAVVWAVLGVSVYYDTAASAAHREGVILANEVVARKGNGEGFEPQFNEKLHAGVEFKLLEQRGRWLHIELPDGKRGWIRADDAELI